MDSSFNPTAEFLIEEKPRRFPWLNVALFLMTCLSTLVVGALLMAGFTETVDDDLAITLSRILTTPSLLLTGLPFSLAIMGILFSHEMGHYLACRYYRIDATLPYFIPAPTLVGTFGAFIKLRAPIPNRSALLDVGVAGPIAGFVVAVPVLIISLMYPRYFVPDPSEPGLGFGEPLIFKLVAWLMGTTPPAGMDMYLHPIGLAAWFGFFATALNLLPVGQLDGGHIAYALFGNFHKRISRGFVLFLLPLGIFYWQGWLFWIAMLLFIGLRHPPTIDESLPLERRHVWLGWIALILFVLCFTPMPIFEI